MYVVRDIFNTKPGKAKELVAKFKKVIPEMEKGGFKCRVMTDIVAAYWTVVVEVQTESLEKYFAPQARNPEMEEAMKGYMELLNGGHREIFKVE